MKKPCFKCGQTKSIDEFYRHPQMADGHLNKCKDCTRADVLGNRNKKAERYRRYDRFRYYRDGAEHRGSSNWKNKHPDLARMSGLRWSMNNPHKKAASTAVNNAVRDGRISKEPCRVCGCADNIQAHHPDYSKPLDVVWLCVKHHAEEHRRLRWGDGLGVSP